MRSRSSNAVRRPRPSACSRCQRRPVAVLSYEPKNELMLEYRQVLQRAMKQEEDDDDDDDDEDDDDDDDDDDDEHSESDDENEHKNGDADVSPKKKPFTEVNHEGARRTVASAAKDATPRAVITQEEMQADMLKFGIRGTKEVRARARSARRRGRAPSARARAPPWSLGCRT